VKFKVKSQLDHIEKGGILDDCGPSSVSALVAWASAYEVDPSAGDGIAMKAKITGQKDRDGVSDNGSSLAQLIKVANGFGAKARWAKSWDDVVASAKRGAGIGIHVQQPAGYAEGQEISAWHEKWKRWWWVKQKQPSRTYGHMVASGFDSEEGVWYFACPTRSGKGAEAYGVKISEANLRKIADSKRVAGKDKLPEYKHTIIVEWPKKVVAPAPVVEPTAKVVVAPVVAPVAKATPTPVATRDEALDTRPTTPAPKTKARVYGEELAALGRVDWGKKANEAGKVLGSALAATEKVKGTMGKLKAGIVYIIANTGIDEAILEALRVGISTGIAVMLATGAPILDMTAEDFRVVGSGAIAATLQVLVRALNKEDASFGVGKLKANREAAEKAARLGTRAK
jgi:hypothetical protein